MDSIMKHYLITRFNIYSDEYFFGDLDRFNKWSESRIDIFKKFTYSSVISVRKNSDFKWIILFDERSPKSIFEMINNLDLSFIRPVFVKHGMGFGRGAIQASCDFIHNDIGADVEFVLTTRIDNDDAIHENYMKFIYGKAAGLTHISPVALNYERGLCFYEGSGHVFNMNVPNMFISLLEPIEELKTIISFSHSKIGDYAEVINIKNNFPVWLMNVHGENWANTKKNGKILEDLSCFNININDGR